MNMSGKVVSFSALSCINAKSLLSFLRMKSSLYERGRRRAIYENSDVYIDSTRTTSSSMVQQSILWRLGNKTILQLILTPYSSSTACASLSIPSSFREKLMKARAIASVLFEVLSTVTSAAGSQVF